MCVNITNVLHENGHEVILCATREGGPLEKFVTSGAKYHILNKKHSADLIAFRRLISIVRKNDITVIHAHSSSLFWAIAVKICVKRIKVIWHDHLGARSNEKGRNPFYRFLSDRIDAVIAVNQELADWSRKNMKVPPERIVLINNFPMLNVVRRSPDPRIFTVVCLANLRPQKDHETLVRAVALLAKQDLPKEMKVILAGSDDDSNYSLRIKHLIIDLGLEQIIEMPGSVEDTASLLAGADCGVLSSVSEGLPVALLEYGMAALPVVVTDVGQCAEATGYGKFGRIVPSGNPEKLADELSWIVQNREPAIAMGATFKEYLKREYGSGQFMKQYECLFSKIAKA